LAIHQEMLKKQQDSVLHNPVTLDQNFRLNLEAIQEPVTIKPIHMPVNVWNRLFERLKTLPENDKQKLADLLQESSLEALLTLQNTSIITELLDPLDSLKIRDRVSTYSLKLREILNKCDQNNDMGQFVQLLVNIQTCTTGKLNGIVHSYILMNQGRELDESVIGKDAFKQETVHFFKEELRRLREITLTDILRNGLKLNRADPHDVYYLRGIIGGEIGLMQKDEIQQIDMNSSGVNKTLRSKTKQQLLDLFYQYYKVEDVVSRIHPRLNDGSIQISGSQDLTMSILNEYLQDTFDEESETYRSDYVLLNDTGKPTGLMPAAAKKLLVLMGILEEKIAVILSNLSIKIKIWYQQIKYQAKQSDNLSASI